MTCAILVPPRGDIGVGAVRSAPSSIRAARSNRGSGFRSTETIGLSERRAASSSEGPISSTAIAFAPAAQKAVAKLLEAGLVKEVRAKAGTPIWRRDDETGQTYALKLTACPRFWPAGAARSNDRSAATHR